MSLREPTSADVASDARLLDVLRGLYDAIRSNKVNVTNLSTRIINVEGADANGPFWVSTVTPGLPDAVDMGALGTGVLQQVVTAGVSAPESVAVPEHAVLFGGPAGLLDYDVSTLYYDKANVRLGVGTSVPDPLALATFRRSQNAATSLFVTNSSAGAAAAADIMLQAAASDSYATGPFLLLGTFGRNRTGGGTYPYFAAGSTYISAYTDDGVTFDMSNVTPGVEPTWRWVSHDPGPTFDQRLQMLLAYTGELSLPESLGAGGLVYATNPDGTLTLATMSARMDFNVGTGTLDLVATGVTPGSYTNTDLTVDAYGRITAASTGSGGGGGGVASVSGTPPIDSTGGANPIISLRYDATSIDLTGGSAIRRAALTGAITAAAGSNTTAFDSFAALSVLANATNAGAVPAPLAAGSAGDVLWRSGTTLVWSAIPESSVTNLVTDLAGKVPTARTLALTSPLTIDGGASADLSANRTIAFPMTAGYLVHGTGASVTGVARAAYNRVSLGVSSQAEIQLYNDDVGATALAGIRIANAASLAAPVTLSMTGTNWTTGGGLTAGDALLELNNGAKSLIVSNLGTGKISFVTTSPGRTERVAIQTGGQVDVSNLAGGSDALVYAVAATGRLTRGTLSGGLALTAGALGITWPAATQILISSGTTTAPVGDSAFTYVTADDHVRNDGPITINATANSISARHIVTVAPTASRDSLRFGVGGITASDGVNREWFAIAPASTTINTAGLSLVATLRVRATDYTLSGVAAGTIASVFADQPTFNGGTISDPNTSAWVFYGAGGTTSTSKLEGGLVANSGSFGASLSVGVGQHIVDTTGIKFFNTGAAVGVAQQTVTGSRGGNAALGSLLNALAAYGIVDDGSTP